MPLLGPFVYYVPLQGLLVYYVPLHGILVYYVPLQGFLVYYVSLQELLIYYAPLQGLLVYYVLLQGFLVFYVALQGLLVYYVPLQGFLIMCLYRGFLLCASIGASCLSCASGPFVLLLFFISAKFCLYYPLSGNYVLEIIGLLHFRHVLDSFINRPIRTSIHAKIFKILNMWLRHFLC